MDILDHCHSTDWAEVVCLAVLEAEEEPGVHDWWVLVAPRSSYSGHAERESIDSRQWTMGECRPIIKNASTIF